MKKKINLLLVATFAMFFTSANAQYRLGGNISFLRSFIGVSSPGIGLKLERAQSDRLGFELGLGYNFAAKMSTIETYTASNNQTTPTSIEVPVDYKVSFISGHLLAKYYLIGEYEDEFGLYGLAGGSLMFAPKKLTFMGDYDDQNYNQSPWVAEQETLGNVYFNLGLGAEKDLNFGFLFLDMQLGIPAGSYNSRSGSSNDGNLAGYLMINSGLKFPLD